MPQVRLFGLVLFVTTVFLAMAAAVTKTTHIKFKHREQAGIVSGASANAPSDAGDVTADDEPGLRFIAVPVVYPLTVAAGLGLLMWFVPSTPVGHVSKRRRKRRR